MPPGARGTLAASSCARFDFVGTLGTRLQPVAKQLVAALLPLTTHKRHRVRVATVRALGPLMHQVRGDARQPRARAWPPSAAYAGLAPCAPGCTQAAPAPTPLAHRARTR
jgi:hypothetical protein